MSRRAARHCEVCGKPIPDRDPVTGHRTRSNRVTRCRVVAHRRREGGVPIELLAVEAEDGSLIVIHAMKMRTRYQELYEEALPWRIVPSD